MTVVKELIRSELDGTLSFGDYTLDTKTKKDGFEFQGDIYKVKTFKEITKLEKNGMFVYESVPGTAVEHFEVSEDVISFKVSGTVSVPTELVNLLCSMPSVGIFSQIPDLLFWMERILHFCHSMPEQKILEDCIRIRCGELLLE